MASSSSYMPSSSSAIHRRTFHQTADIAPGSDVPVVVPAPNPQPALKWVAFGFMVFLCLLQFLPATHFRHPSDPSRNWVPFNSNASSALSHHLGVSGNDHSGFNGDDGMVHVVSWMDCLDLRVLAVLANSTLSSASYPDLVFFHFFVPGGKEDKVSFYKLKVLFPHSNLEIHGQEEVNNIINTAFSGAQYGKPSFEAIVPFIIPRVFPFLSKFIYVSADLIMKGRVEELIRVDLGNYAIAAAEDCSERLNSYVNSDVLGAIQRSASKPWVSETPYAMDTCMPDFRLLLVNARTLERDFLEAVLWWSKVLNLSERTGVKNPAVALLLHNRYLKLDSSWSVKSSSSSEMKDSMVIHYDGPKTICSDSAGGIPSRHAHGNVWTRYLPSNSDRILGY